MDETRLALAKLGFGSTFAFGILGLFLVLMDEGRIKIKGFSFKRWFDQQTLTFVSLFASPTKKQP